MRKLIIKTTSLLLLTACHPVYAVCDYLNITLNSHHWDRDKGYNENHVNLGCGGIGGGEWSFLYFRNSHDDHAALLTKHRHWKRIWGIDLGYEYGLVAGYDVAPVAPVVLPSASFEVGRIRVTGYILFLEGLALGTAYRF